MILQTNNAEKNKLLGHQKVVLLIAFSNKMEEKPSPMKLRHHPFPCPKEMVP